MCMLWCTRWAWAVKKELQPKWFLKGGDGIKETLPCYTHQTVPCCRSGRNLQVAGAYG